MQEDTDTNDRELQTFLAALGKRLLAARKKTGLSQAALADKFDMSDRTILRYEKGRSSPDIKYIIQLADLTEMSVLELMFGTEKPDPQKGDRATTTFKEIEEDVNSRNSVNHEKGPTVKTEEFAGWTMLVAGREQLTFDIVVRGRTDRASLVELRKKATG